MVSFTRRHGIPSRRSWFIIVWVLGLPLGAKAAPLPSASEPLKSQSTAEGLVTGGGTHLRAALTCAGGSARIDLVPLAPPAGPAYPSGTFMSEVPVSFSNHDGVCTAGICTVGMVGRSCGGLGDADCDTHRLIPYHEIAFDPSVVRVWLEFRISNWDPDGDGVTVPTGTCASGICVSGLVGGTCVADQDCRQPAPAVVRPRIVGAGLLDADSNLHPDGLTTDDGDEPPLAPYTLSCPEATALGDDICALQIGLSGTRCVSGLANCGSAFCCSSGFFDVGDTRADSVCAGIGCTSGPDTSSADIAWFVSANPPEVMSDDGTVRFAGYSVIDVPPNAKGRYFIDLDPSALFDSQLIPQEIPVFEVRGASIRPRTGYCMFALGTPGAGCVDGVTQSECASQFAPPMVFHDGQTCLVYNCFENANCVDSDACTFDFCWSSFSCDNPLIPGFDVSTECCNPADGSQQILDDNDPCTDDSCSLPNSRGVPIHTSTSAGTCCDDGDPCTIDDQCGTNGCGGTPLDLYPCQVDFDCPHKPDGTNYPCAAGACRCAIDAQPQTIVWDPASQTNRSLAVQATAALSPALFSASALKVAMIDLMNPIPANPPCCPPPNFSPFEVPVCFALGEELGCGRWVGPPVAVREAQDNAEIGSFVAARLQCTPYYADWASFGTVHVFGAEILPSSTYELRTYAWSCRGTEDACSNVSSPIEARTRRWGDVSEPFTPPTSTIQPDSLDVTALLNKFRNVPGSPSKSVAQVQPNALELNVDVGALDIVAVVDAFRGLMYPYSGPCPCPSTVICDATPCAMPSDCGGGACIRTCVGGVYDHHPCLNQSHCPDGTCGGGACRDRCGRCR